MLSGSDQLAGWTGCREGAIHVLVLRRGKVEQRNLARQLR